MRGWGVNMNTDKIKIDKYMRFDIGHLMDEIDPDHEFTLTDVIYACMNSSVPIKILSELLQCPYIEDYFEELKNGKKDEDYDREILHLELHYGIDKDDEFPDTSHGWSFDGVGKKGDIPQDIIDHYSEEEVQEMRDEGFTQRYAVEFTPICDLADYVIKIGDEAQLIDWDNDSADNSTTIKGKPSINLIEVLYAIFWELSFLGSPEERDEKKEDLLGRVDAYKKASEDGTLKVIDFEEVKEKFKEKYDLDN
jgi:hypothetical protein